jgi:hypothetical protein
MARVASTMLKSSDSIGVRVNGASTAGLSRQDTAAR